MSTKDTTVAPAATALVAPKRELAKTATAVVHQEPEHGGSYTRDLSSGALVRQSPAPADQSNQEEA